MLISYAQNKNNQYNANVRNKLFRLFGKKYFAPKLYLIEIR